MYKLLRNILFLFRPEWVHYFSMNCLKIVCNISLFKKWMAAVFGPSKKNNLKFEIWSLSFPNRIGLGAGFDKNAKYLRELECLGFGFVEIGTVTPLPQPGNDKPRLFRLAKDKALINRMGFNNDGVKVVAERLRLWRNRQLAISNKQSNTRRTIVKGSPFGHDSRLIIGGNIGKNKVTPNEEAWKDYEICFRELFDCVDYIAVNVSSPNTPGLRELQEKESLRNILSHLIAINRPHNEPKPLLLKIAPDLTAEQIDDVIDLSLELRLDGLIVSNTTINRDQLSEKSKVKCETIGAGGLSGRPLKSRSTELIRYISEKTGGRLPIIASGGIFSGADANEKFKAGASLVQVWTGFIYEGPAIVKKICRSLSIHSS